MHFVASLERLALLNVLQTLQLTLQPELYLLSLHCNIEHAQCSGLQA